MTAAELDRRARDWEGELRAHVSRSLVESFPELRVWLSDREGAWDRLLDDLLAAPSREWVRVLSSWYWTLAAQRRPDYWEGVEAAVSGDGERCTSEELKQALAL